MGEQNVYDGTIVQDERSVDGQTDRQTEIEKVQMDRQMDDVSYGQKKRKGELIDV